MTKQADWTQDDNHSERTKYEPDRRQFVKGVATLAGTVPFLGSAAALNAAEGEDNPPGCSEWKQPTAADFEAIVGKGKAEFLDRVLAVLENEVVPKTNKGVRAGNKLFGAAILNKSDLSTVLAATNTETGNPLMHGEVTAIFDFYDIPKGKRPSPKDTIFIATHEPCPLCLSSITWGGWDNFFYLFTYEDSRDAYGIPHDIVMLEEIFRDPDGSYNEKNKFWSSWSIRDLIASLPEENRGAFTKRIEALKQTYAEMSDIYQKAKAAGTGADVPLK
jgi:tRNA(Arg) A34 adenosine deaminase TadA